MAVRTHAVSFSNLPILIGLADVRQPCSTQFRLELHGSSTLLSIISSDLKQLCFLYCMVYSDYTYYISGYCFPQDTGIQRTSQQQTWRVILLCIIIWCLAIPNTMVSNGIPAIHFPPNPFTAVIAWTWSWSCCRESRMAPLLFRQILSSSGMLGFCFCSQHLQCLTLDPSPSNVHYITLETYNNPENGNYYYNYFNYTKYACYTH